MLKQESGIKRFIDQYGVFLALLLLIAVLSLLSPNFFTLSNMINILRQCSVYLILSFGVTFVFICGGIDLSIGNILNFAGCVVAILLVERGMNMWLAIVLTLVIGIAVGALNGICVAYLRVPPFLTTLGTMYIFKGIAQLITHDSSITGLPSPFSILGGKATAGIPNQVIIAVVVFVILYIIMNYTRFGRYVFAVGSNERTARLSGINVNKIKILSYVVSSLCAVLAGIIMASRLKLASASLTSGYEMDAIAAVCIGGTSIGGGRGSLVKTVAGALMLSVVRTGLNILGFSSSMQSVIIGAIIILVVAFDMRSQKSE